MPHPTAPENDRGPSPLWLLAQVSLRQAGRRMWALRRQSRLLTGLVALFLGGYFVLAFGLFWKGFGFIARFPGLGAMLTERLLFLLFALLFVLLWFSNLVIAYTNLFKNRETAFLIPLPLSARTIFQWKFIESTVLASWAFVFLIAPLVAAFGITARVPWHFYLLTPLLTGVYIVLPALGGSACAILLGRYLDRRGFQLAALVTGLLVLGGLAVALQPAPVTDTMLESRVLTVLDRLLYRTRFSQYPALPSYWLSSSLLNWSEGALTTALMFALLLLSHALFFGFIALQGLGEPFYEAFSTAHGRGALRRLWARSSARMEPAGLPGQRGWLERCFGLCPGLATDVRALLVKDVRLFWRDTTQWGQSLVLFGLLAAYILNLRHFSQQLTNPFWVHLVSHLNVFACSLNLATLTTRFVFPQFSQEGKRVWVVGLAPLGLVRILRAKFWLCAVASLLLTNGLIALSCQMLKLPWERTGFYMGAITLMALTLNGVAIGLGALYPNFKEDNPSKIVSGFGGTFCLVLSFLYLVGAVVLLALSSPWDRPTAHPEWRLAIGGALFLLWSTAVGWIPYRAGLRRVTRFEVA